MESILKLTAFLGSAILGMALMAGSPAHAQSPAVTMKMDLNKDGRVSREEFLSVMTEVFNKHSGGKDYCTPEEAAKVMREINAMYVN